MPSAAPAISQEKLERVRGRVRDAFILFEHKENSRLVDIKDVPTAVRATGVNPTQVQINLIIDQIASLSADSDLSSSGLVTLENFDLVVTNFLTQQEATLIRDDYHTLLRAFRAFDAEGRGFIDAEVIKTALGGKGESMSEDELSKMLLAAADDQGKIFYEDYAQKLCNDGRSM